MNETDIFMGVIPRWPVQFRDIRGWRLEVTHGKFSYFVEIGHFLGWNSTHLVYELSQVSKITETKRYIILNGIFIKINLNKDSMKPITKLKIPNVFGSEAIIAIKAKYQLA